MNGDLRQTKVSMVKSATTTETRVTTLGSILSAIQHGRYSKNIKAVRSAYASKGKDAANDLKKQLPAAMFSGVFSRRTADQLLTHTGLLCADLDSLDGELELVRNKVNADPHTVASFVSPTGTGLKVLVRVPADAARHRESFEAVRSHYQHTLGLTIDSACSDVSRLCFVSDDPALFFNPDAAEMQVAPKPRTTHSDATTEEARIKHAMNHIPASFGHDDWVRVLMGLHAWDSIRGKELARAWSATCPAKFRESDFETAWRSFKGGGGVKLATVFEIAKRYGWRPTSSHPSQVTPKVENREPSPEPITELVIPRWPDAPRKEAYRGPLGEFVRRLDPHTEADPFAILLQAIVGFGNLIGRTANFAVEADKHYSNLNAVIVGNSSKARKGTSWGHVIRLLRQVDPTWPRPMTGLSTGEGLIHCVRDPIIKVDKDGAEVVTDPGVSDKRLLALESEFGRMLQCSNRENNTLSAVIRQAFDTGHLRVPTKSSPEIATGAHISTIGHITSIELNLLLTKNDIANGLANRSLWAAVRRSKLLPEAGNAAAIDMSDIVEQLRRAREFAKQVGCIRRDNDAGAFWREIYTRLSVERPGLLGAVVSRAEAMMLRLSMILAVIDCSPVVRIEHLEAALAIWDYCEASTAFIFGDRLANPLAERVLQMLQDAGEAGFTLAAVYEGLSGHVVRAELHGALRELHSQGLARFEKVQTSGRPRQVWFATKTKCEISEQTANKESTAPATAPSTTDPLSSLSSLNSLGGEWEEVI